MLSCKIDVTSQPKKKAIQLKPNSIFFFYNTLSILFSFLQIAFSEMNVFIACQMFYRFFFFVKIQNSIVGYYVIFDLAFICFKSHCEIFVLVCICTLNHFGNKMLYNGFTNAKLCLLYTISMWVFEIWYIALHHII